MKDKQYEHNEEENLKNRRAPAQHGVLFTQSLPICPVSLRLQ